MDTFLNFVYNRNGDSKAIDLYSPKNFDIALISKSNDGEKITVMSHGGLYDMIWKMEIYKDGGFALSIGILINSLPKRLTFNESFFDGRYITDVSRSTHQSFIQLKNYLYNYIRKKYGFKEKFHKFDNSIGDF